MLPHTLLSSISLFLLPLSATKYISELRAKISVININIPPELNTLLGENVEAADRTVASGSLLERMHHMNHEGAMSNWIMVALLAIKSLCDEKVFVDHPGICERNEDMFQRHQFEVDKLELTRLALESSDNLQPFISAACYALTYSTSCHSLHEKSSFRQDIPLEKTIDLVSLLQVFTRNAKLLTHNGKVQISSYERLKKLLCLLRMAAPLLMEAFDTRDPKSPVFKAIKANAGDTKDLLEYLNSKTDFSEGFMKHLLPIGMKNLRSMKILVSTFSKIPPQSLKNLPLSTCVALLQEPLIVHPDFVPSETCLLKWLEGILSHGFENTSEIPVSWIVGKETLFLQIILLASRSNSDIPAIDNLSIKMARHIFGSQPNTYCHLLKATDLLMLKGTGLLSHISASCFAQIKNIDTVDISELMKSFNDEVLALYNGTFHPKTTRSISGRQLRHLASLLPQDQLICQDHSFIKNINPAAFHTLPPKCLLDYVAENNNWEFDENIAFLFESDMMELLNIRTMEDIFPHLNLDQVKYLPWDIAVAFYQNKYTHELLDEIRVNIAAMTPESSLEEISFELNRIIDMIFFINRGSTQVTADFQELKLSIPRWLFYNLPPSFHSHYNLMLASDMSMLKELLNVPENVDIQMPHIVAYLDKCGMILKLFTALIQTPLLEEISDNMIRNEPPITDQAISFLSFAASISSSSALQYLRSIVKPHVGTNLYEVIPGATLDTHHMFLWMLFAPNMESVFKVIRLPPTSLSNTKIKVYRDSNERYDMGESYKFILHNPLTVLCPKSYIVTDGSADAGAVRINWIDQVIHGTLLNNNYGLKALDSNPNYYKFPFLSSPTYGTFASVVILKAKQLNMLIPFTLDPKFFKIMAGLEVMDHQVEEYFEEIYKPELTELKNILKIEASRLDIIPLEDIELRTPVKSYPYLPIDVSLFGYSPETTLAQLKTNSFEYFSDIRNLALKNFKELIWNFRHYFGMIYAIENLSYPEDFSSIDSYFMPIIPVSPLTVLDRFHFSSAANKSTVASVVNEIMLTPQVVFTEFISLLEPDEVKAFLAAVTGSKMIDLRHANLHLKINPILRARFSIDFAFQRKSILSRIEFLEIMEKWFPEISIDVFSSLPEWINEEMLRNFSSENPFLADYIFNIDEILHIAFQPVISYERFEEIMTKLELTLTGSNSEKLKVLADLSGDQEVFYPAVIMACFNLLTVSPQPMRSLILSIVQQINSDPAQMDDGFARLPHGNENIIDQWNNR